MKPIQEERGFSVKIRSVEILDAIVIALFQVHPESPHEGICQDLSEASGFGATRACREGGELRGRARSGQDLSSGWTRSKEEERKRNKRLLSVAVCCAKSASLSHVLQPSIHGCLQELAQSSSCSKGQRANTKNGT